VQQRFFSKKFVGVFTVVLNHIKAFSQPAVFPDEIDLFSACDNCKVAEVLEHLIQKPGIACVKYLWYIDINSTWKQKQASEKENIPWPIS